jgi:suppressor of ftsI
VPVPGLDGLVGTIELRRAASPFGVAVTADGHHRFELSLVAENLPDPRSLGAFTTFVAWVTTPTLSPMRKLGEVKSGRTELGEVSLDKFLVLVTAEASAGVAERAGRIVMRGTSPSMLMLPSDAAMLPGRPMVDHSAHAAGGWRMPPMHPSVPSMTPGLEGLVPRVAPWLPGAGVDPATLPAARPRRTVSLRDGDTLALTAQLVRRTIGGRTMTMYGFNGQYPGPLIRVRQEATIVVDFTNRIDMPTAVHWHGVRLENRFDGVPHVTQEPVPPGGRFRYIVRFPDAGIYWYHPHHREDIQQDLGLYGNLLVQPTRAGYYGPAHREEVLTLDDLLIGEEGLVPYGAESTTHALMGRFGNVFLTNGERDYRLSVRRGEIVRFFLTNVSNTRTFNLSLGGAPMKIVASDVGKFEREEWVESVVLAPAERYVIDARFERAGAVALTNRVQAINHPAGFFFPEVDTLGIVTVAGAPVATDLGDAFSTLRRNDDVIADIDRFRGAFTRPPDRTLVLTMRVKELPFGLVQAMRLDTGYVNPVEWSGTMPMMDWIPTGRDVTWVLRDPTTGKENLDIDWRFRRGDVVKLRLVNDRHTLHPMQHPVHIHGQRFLVLAQNGQPTRNLVWKDTVLLPSGATVDLLLEPSNPGRWMLHCHIAEHLEAGMHAVFTVEP